MAQPPKYYHLLSTIPTPYRLMRCNIWRELSHAVYALLIQPYDLTRENDTPYAHPNVNVTRRVTLATPDPPLTFVSII